MAKEITPEQRAAVIKLLKPMIDTAKSMTAEEIVLAMQGFYATTEENVPWYAFVLRWQLPPMLAIIGQDTSGYEQAWMKALGGIWNPETPQDND